jgi:hypothetical protein
MHSLPLTPKRKQTEWTPIQLIAPNNTFPQKLVQNLDLQLQHKKPGSNQRKKQNKKRTTFTYYGPRTRKTTDLFKNTNIAISFMSTDTLQQLTKPDLTSNSQEQEKSGIYKLLCNTCQMSYIGQTSRSLRQRHQKHIRYIRHNESQSAYALHVLNKKHEYGTINDTMTLLKHINKISLLLPYEKLYIQSHNQHKQLISEQYIGEHNPTYQLIHNTYNTSLLTRPIYQYFIINTTKPVPSQLASRQSTYIGMHNNFIISAEPIALSEILLLS